MRARVRRTIKVFSGICAAGFPQGPGASQAEIPGGENGGDLFDYVARWVLSIFHAILHHGKPAAMG
jgi:hypothetical protein